MMDPYFTWPITPFLLFTRSDQHPFPLHASLNAQPSTTYRGFARNPRQATDPRRSPFSFPCPQTFLGLYPSPFPETALDLCPSLSPKTSRDLCPFLPPSKHAPCPSCPCDPPASSHATAREGDLCCPSLTPMHPCPLCLLPCNLDDHLSFCHRALSLAVFRSCRHPAGRSVHHFQEVETDVMNGYAASEIWSGAKLCILPPFPLALCLCPSNAQEERGVLRTGGNGKMDLDDGGFWRALLLRCWRKKRKREREIDPVCPFLSFSSCVSCFSFLSCSFSFSFSRPPPLPPSSRLGGRLKAERSGPPFPPRLSIRF
mmetsp:Transcript_30974/g.61076  ORF Transcript_30974/g.61076 Transcript_30974/m.61076 type:complete len:314 (+) Transcript_30974:30-971(+)